MATVYRERITFKDICPVGKCLNLIHGEQVMCQAHWELVPYTVQERVAQAVSQKMDVGRWVDCAVLEVGRPR